MVPTRDSRHSCIYWRRFRSLTAASNEETQRPNTSLLLSWSALPARPSLCLLSPSVAASELCHPFPAQPSLSWEALTAGFGNPATRPLRLKLGAWT